MKVVNRRFLALLSLLSACGPAATEADAGQSRPADAGPRADGGLSAPDGGPGATDAGPVEPTLSSSVLYREDFETYASRMMLEGAYPLLTERGGAFAVESSTAAAGNRSVRIDYAGDAGCTDSEVSLGKQLLGDPVQLVASWRFRVQAGFVYLAPACPGAASTELVLTRPQDPVGRVALEVSAEPGHPALGALPGAGWRVTVNDAFATAPRRAVYAQQFRLATHGPLALPPGTWHRLTMFLERESSLGAGDGVVRVWVDGALVIDRDRAATGTAPFAGVRYPTTLKGGGSRPQARWLDEVVLSTP